ncbi:uncharacterized protein LOC126898713 isoform X2 [Daktulosphaira vitifoliae]|uniref:uncharacterized protein LOC126898713 isoform X2 n=1 Tax=Daktulosphaira vitifoliae TaxID=58002 RepID=UPI0021A982F4|nr:uncharacterized protein LOC126898713 isoform X2 [Daktulosphaira vitifoliae]
MKIVVSLKAILVYFLIQSTGIFSSSNNSLNSTEELEEYYSPWDLSDDDEEVTRENQCRICLGALAEETCTLKCCNTKYCKECIIPWLYTGVDKCLLCANKIPNLCYACKSDISEDGKKYVTTCCKRRLCFNCFLHNNKEKFLLCCPFCNKIRQKRKQYDVSKLKILCKECKTKKGKYSYSSICPHEFCKECFKQKIKENDHCPYCNQPLIKRMSNQCSCCFEAISNKTDTFKHCDSIFCVSCILSSLKIKGNTNCLICSKDVITTACHLCKSVIPEDHGKIYLTKCCKKRICHSCLYSDFIGPGKSDMYVICPCCFYYHEHGPMYKIIWLKKNCKKCNKKPGQYSINYFCPELYCVDCIKTINRKNHFCKH